MASTAKRIPTTKEPTVNDNDFIRLFEEFGPYETARRLGVSARSVQNRRINLENKLQCRIVGPFHPARTHVIKENPQRISTTLENGTVLIGSDGHYWPGQVSTAHKAFVKFCKTLKPSIVVFNGDAFDGASISRHQRINWETTPTVQEEIEAVQERLGEIEKAAFKARKIWTLGNHDARFETRLANIAPEYANVHGVHLKDHFPSFEGCYSLWINDSVVIKHRFKNGVHATHNATLWAGKTIITGHLHSLKVTPFDDYNGTRWGVDTGCIADPSGPQFEYTEDNPRNHRSGFIVLTFKNGRLLWPEIVAVTDPDTVQFRGELIRV